MLSVWRLPQNAISNKPEKSFFPCSVHLFTFGATCKVIFPGIFRAPCKIQVVYWNNGSWLGPREATDSIQWSIFEIEILLSLAVSIHPKPALYSQKRGQWISIPLMFIFHSFTAWCMNHHNSNALFPDPGGEVVRSPLPFFHVCKHGQPYHCCRCSPWKWNTMSAAPFQMEILQTSH